MLRLLRSRIKHVKTSVRLRSQFHVVSRIRDTLRGYLRLPRVGDNVRSHSRNPHCPYGYPEYGGRIQ